MTPEIWRALALAVETAFEALGDGVKRVEPNEEESAIVQRRALRYARALPAGHRLAASDLMATRPVPPGALPPYRRGELEGRALRHAVEADAVATSGDVAGG